MTAREDRRVLREFVRTHHPDVGGDPEAFRAGLAELRRRQAGPGRARGPVVATHRRRGLRAIVDRLVGRIRRQRRHPRVR